MWVYSHAERFYYNSNTGWINECFYYDNVTTHMDPLQEHTWQIHIILYPEKN